MTTKESTMHVPDDKPVKTYPEPPACCKRCGREGEELFDGACRDCLTDDELDEHIYSNIPGSSRW